MSEIQQTELLHFLFSDTLKCDILEPPSLKYLEAFMAVFALICCIISSSLKMDGIFLKKHS